MGVYIFKWNLSEKEFARLKKFAGHRGFGGECYGNIYVGNYCIDVVLDWQELEDAEPYRIVSLDYYRIGVDGYSYTRGRQTPYTYEDRRRAVLPLEKLMEMNYDQFKDWAEDSVKKEFSTEGQDFLQKEVFCPMADWT